MVSLHSFTFNPYQENTYILADPSGECVIIDPGCYGSQEQQQLRSHIETHNLKVVALINTHGHIDHMLGNAYVKRTFQVPFVAHEGIAKELEYVSPWASMMGLQVEPSPLPDETISEGSEVTFGTTKLKVFDTPGHSPAHISLYCETEKLLVSGDVLFKGSIGRTDLPGGDYQTLMESIVNKLLPLPDDVQVFSGHGTETTIGDERERNPFVLDYIRSSKG